MTDPVAPTLEADFSRSQLWPPAPFPLEFHPKSKTSLSYLPPGLDRGSLRAENGIWEIFDYGGDSFGWTPFHPTNPLHLTYANMANRYPPAKDGGRWSFGHPKAADGQPEFAYYRLVFGTELVMDSMEHNDLKYGAGRWDALKTAALKILAEQEPAEPPVVPPVVPPVTPPTDQETRLRESLRECQLALLSRQKELEAIGKITAEARAWIETNAPKGGGAFARHFRETLAEVEKELK